MPMHDDMIIYPAMEQEAHTVQRVDIVPPGASVQKNTDYWLAWDMLIPSNTYFANDDTRSPNEKTVLKDTFAKVNLPAEIEVYTGAAHGWCPPDSGVYNEPQAEKAWSRLLALYGKALA